MPDRFRQISDEELFLLKFGLSTSFGYVERHQRETLRKLKTEIEHEQVQREHAEARQRVVA